MRGRYGSGVPGFTEQVRAAAGHALVRPGADDTYADGDDSTWMEVDWPAFTRTVEVLGRRVNVIDTGGGDQPILFIHGLGGLWQNWLLNIPALMRTHRVIAPDLPGFGRSEMPAGRISIQGFARVMDALCGELGVESPIVVGNSMGGFIGAELAIAFPTRVAKLVLISAAGLSVEHLKRQPILAAGRLVAVGTARTGVKSLPVVSRPRLRRAALQLVVRYPERISVPLATELVAGAGTDGFVGGLDAVLGYKFRDRLPEIEAPVLIVWGRNDILIPVGDAHEYERLIGANAHAVVFEDTGHLSMLERPSRFNKLLAEFIAGNHRPEDDIPGVTG
jgi:pimeloyl-ACP methyl ester carboxylesterase